jgi:tRNA threonylcarbamoyladenosine biosynthesis protein TsaE
MSETRRMSETRHDECDVAHEERGGAYGMIVPTAEAMREIGLRLGGLLRAGDLLILSGDLGAGKTTLTQGIGEGVKVRGPITSPTFVISRVHPSLAGGPPLVHVDAYRLGGFAEVDDLDLDADLESAVTVVEWGEGLVEGLSEERLEIRVRRGDDDSEVREIDFTPVGDRWAAVDLSALLRP